MLKALVSLFVLSLAISVAEAADPDAANSLLPETVNEHEPVKYFERYKPSYFLLGKPNTKSQISFKVSLFRDFPLYFAYSHLLIWDLFKESAPFRDFNANPEFFYRLRVAGGPRNARDLDIGFYEHESNGRPGIESRGWNHSYLRFTSNNMLSSEGIWWSVKFQIAHGIEEGPSKDLPKRRGLYEFQVGISNLFERLFDVNEVIFRIYGGGRSRVNPLEGGQEITYREKDSRRKFLLPLYFQIFHGYGEYLLDADDKHWGFRAGVGF